MKTSEELQTMSHDELVKYAQYLQDDIKKVNSSSDYWRNEYCKESTRFASFRNAVKSVVELIETTNNQ